MYVIIADTYGEKINKKLIFLLLSYTKMEKQTYYNTPKFTLKNKIYEAKILDIYDGDTITICINLEGFNYVKMNVRLEGIDTPELHGNEKELGISARNFLINKLTDITFEDTVKYSRDNIRKLINNNTHIIKVMFGDFDKYGSPLCIIYKNNININDLMIHNKYGKKYDGGKKESW